MQMMSNKRSERDTSKVMFPNQTAQSATEVLASRPEKSYVML